MASVVRAVQPGAWARVYGFCLDTAAVTEMEARKLAHDPTEVFTRAIQPLLWLLVFGQVFGRLRGIPTGGVPYRDYLAPGIISQSVVFVSIFFGISLIAERDAGVLHKLLVAPIPRTALVLGKSLSAGLRGLVQSGIIFAVATLLGVHFHWGLLNLLGALVTIFLGATVFSGLSMAIACLVRTRERFMGMGQVITMPLFFASNALYPVQLMPAWLKAIAAVNPMSFIVDALRFLLLATPGRLHLDLAGLLGFAVALVLLGGRLFQRLVV